MTDSLFDFLGEALYASPELAILRALGWGVLSILLSPCHLSSIPLIVGYITSKGGEGRQKSFAISLVFSLGILVTIAIIGIITALLGGLIGDLGSFGNYFVAIVFFAVGLYLMDLINLPIERINFKPSDKSPVPAAFLLGLLFGIGLGPCTFAFMAPVLGVVFSTAEESIPYSVALLGAFALGDCGVITAAGTLVTLVQKYLKWTEDSKVILWIKRVCGALVFLGGIYLILIAH